MKLPSRHELAIRNMFRSEVPAWQRWIDRVKIDWWAIRW